MAPFNLTEDVMSLLIRHLNDTLAAHNTTINARDTITPDDYTHPKISNARVAAIIVTGVFLTIIVVFVFYRSVEKLAERQDSESPMPQGHVYGHDNASSHGLDTLRPDWTSGRPSFQHVENSVPGTHQWGGGTGGGSVARPAPAATHGRDRQDESPPPPCK